MNPLTTEMEETCLSDLDGTVGSETPAAFAEIFYRWCTLWARSEAFVDTGVDPSLWNVVPRR